eukprot:6645729-Alexandrium_andersonii.AAC.1
MSASLVGSEMCIRDRSRCCAGAPQRHIRAGPPAQQRDLAEERAAASSRACLLYTSDAADDM